jgi:biotin transport system substrate-specific component
VSTPPSFRADRPRRLAARDLALIAVFAALIAALGLGGAFNVPFSEVPITAQTLGVMLAGSILGARRGALAVLVFLVLVAIGLPLLPPSPARPQGGLAVFTSVTAGFLIGWMVGAFVIGALVWLRPARFSLGWIVLANVIGGMLVVYAVGLPVQAWVAGVPFGKVLKGALVFLPGDTAKVIISSVVTGAVLRGYPGIVPPRRADRRLQTGATGPDGSELQGTGTGTEADRAEPR